MAAAVVLLAMLRVWRSGADAIAIAAFVIAALFVISTLAAPAALAPVYRWWMRIAEVLGWINTRVLLVLIYYLVVTPLGLIMRLARRSPLDGGYWTEPPRNSYGDRHYEKQF